MATETYEVKIIPRDGMGQTKDDYHATVTRISDGKELIFIADWVWLIQWRTRRKALERAFNRSDKHDLKMGTSFKVKR